jgi:rhodanese-related sulfurtransferase
MSELIDGVCDLDAGEFLEIMRSTEDGLDVVLLDIRTPDEYDVYHLRNALNIDFYHESFADELDKLDQDKLYLIYCRTGRRTGTADNNARDLMQRMGFKRVANMLGGIHAFVKVDGADDFIDE